MAIERIDYYSDDEYQQALAWHEEDKRRVAEEEGYRRYCAEQEALLNKEGKG